VHNVKAVDAVYCVNAVHYVQAELTVYCVHAMYCVQAVHALYCVHTGRTFTQHLAKTITLTQP